jgi:hypothetical protein
MRRLDLSRRAGAAAIVAAICGAGIVTAILAGSGGSTSRSTTTVAVVRTLAPRTSTTASTRTASASTPSATSVAPPTTSATTTSRPVTTAAAPRLPDVTTQPLDRARSTIEDAGAVVRVDGGGLFGVVDESAWTVCSSSPGAGTPLVSEETVTLHVERSCD